MIIKKQNTTWHIIWLTTFVIGGFAFLFLSQNWFSNLKAKKL